MRDTRRMFENFTAEQIQVDDASIFVRHGGEGPPVLLLHGHPRTSATWHRVAPQLIERGFRIICPDLRGYGRSRGPTPSTDHTEYSKRKVAHDLVKVMRALGHDRFALAGHDRGSYVAFRLALDHPKAVSRVALMDCVPISEHLARITRGREESDRRAGRRLLCPALILWSLRDDLEDLHGDPVEIWKPWARQVRGQSIDSGHPMAEEAPRAVTACLADFFSTHR